MRTGVRLLHYYYTITAAAAAVYRAARHPYRLPLLPRYHTDTAVYAYISRITLFISICRWRVAVVVSGFHYSPGAQQPSGLIVHRGVFVRPLS